MGKKFWAGSSYADTLNGGDKKRYEEKIALCDGDPYLMDLSEFSLDEDSYPRVGLVEISDYLVLSTSFISKKQMKAFRSLEAHNYVTSGCVNKPRTKCVRSNRVLAISEVSTKRSLPLLVPISA